ncbi:MAG: twin-arginine translocase subunit TatC, partial [Rhodospirillales bacterium]
MADNRDDFEETKAPLLEHLIELRGRLLKSFVALIVLFFICYYFAPQIYTFLVHPLADILHDMGGERRMIFTALHEAFFTYLKVAFFAALFLAFPFIAMQMWMFVAPGSSSLIISFVQVCSGLLGAFHQSRMVAPQARAVRMGRGRLSDQMVPKQHRTDDRGE